MTRFIVLIVLAVVAVAVAYVLQRRRPDPPSAPSYRAPSQLDRNDFDQPETPVLAVVFASTTCNTCPEVWAQVEQLPSELRAPELVVQRIDVQDGADLHKRYKIDGVPTTILANQNGVVAEAFFGPIDDGDLDEALRKLGLDRGQ